MSEIKTHVHKYYLGLIGFIAALGGFLFGFDTAVISGTIGFVKKQYVLDAVMEGWFVSSALIGCILGAAIAGALSDRFGRKKILMLSGILFLLSALGCMVATTFTLLIWARLLGGVGVGIASMLSPVYLSEMSPPSIRGAMVTFYQLAVTVGILLAYFSNAAMLHLSETVSFAPGWLEWVVTENVWRAMFGMEAIPALAFFLLLFAVPESARWLIKQGRHEEGLAVLSRIVPKETAQAEVQGIRQTMAHEEGRLSELFKPGLRVAMLLGVLLPFMVQFSGINAIIYYGPEILNQAGFTISRSLGGQVTVGITNVVFTILAIWKIDTWGRRPLYLVGVLGTITMLTLLGLNFWFEHHQGPIVLVLILVYVGFFSLSLGPVHWTILAEIFPNKIRGRAMSVATLMVWIGTAIVGQIFPLLQQTVGSAGTFWFFAITSGILSIFIWRIMPETKNKSLEEIERHWESGGKS